MHFITLDRIYNIHVYNIDVLSKLQGRNIQVWRREDIEISLRATFFWWITVNLNASFIPKTQKKMNNKHLEPRCPNRMQLNSKTIQNIRSKMRQNSSIRYSIDEFILNSFCIEIVSFFKIKQLMKSLRSSHEIKISLNCYYIIADYSKTSATIPLSTQTKWA